MGVADRDWMRSIDYPWSTRRRTEPYDPPPDDGAADRTDPPEDESPGGWLSPIAVALLVASIAILCLAVLAARGAG